MVISILFTFGNTLHLSQPCKVIFAVKLLSVSVIVRKYDFELLPWVRDIQLQSRSDTLRIIHMCEWKHLKEIVELKSIHVHKANVQFFFSISSSASAISSDLSDIMLYSQKRREGIVRHFHSSIFSIALF